jgi:hypothetical protein
MQDEDLEIDFTKPDDLEENTALEHNRAGARWGKTLTWGVGIGCALYGIAKLSNWLIDFPKSLKDTGGLIFTFVATLVGISLLSLIESLVNSIIREFRIRSRQINHRLREIESIVLTGERGAGDRDKKNDDSESDEELLAKYHAAAERGEAWAQYNLGVTYFNGARVPKDNVQAAFWYRKAADQGDTSSRIFLADLLMGDSGVSEDRPEAIRLYKLVSDDAHTYSAMAEYRLGEIFAEGKGTPRDYKEAIKWWEKAARHGWTLGSYNLGELYESGAEGIAQNFEEAYFWYYVGCSEEDRKETMSYRATSRDNMAKRLNPERRREVQERAQQWLEGKRS